MTAFNIFNIISFFIFIQFSHGFIKVPVQKYTHTVDFRELGTLDINYVGDPTSYYDNKMSIFYKGSIFIGELGIGNPAQNFTALFDTGSSNLWAMSSECLEPVCKRFHLFNSNSSETCLIELDNDIHLEYGTGEIDGHMAYDSIWISGIEVSNFSFSLVEKPIGDVWEGVTFDTLVGLGFPMIASNTQMVPIQELYNQKKIDDMSFSFYMPFNSSQGYFILGGIDYTLNATPFYYHSIILPEYWNIFLDDICIKNHSSQEIVYSVKKSLNISKIIGIVDTGTTFIAGTPDIIDGIMPYLKPTSCLVPGNTLVIVIGGIEYEIPGNDKTTLYGKFWDKTHVICVPNVSPIDLGPAFPNALLMGETFTSLYYTHFDMMHLRVGFAKIKDLSQLKNMQQINKQTNQD